MKATARILSPDAPLPYLEAPLSGDCSKVVFWTFHWARDTAEFEELKAYLYTKTQQAQFDRNQRLWMALCVSQSQLKARANVSLQILKDAGGLLFAWAGTTVVHNFGVPA